MFVCAPGGDGVLALWPHHPTNLLPLRPLRSFTSFTSAPFRIVSLLTLRLVLAGKYIHKSPTSVSFCGGGRCCTDRRQGREEAEGDDGSGVNGGQVEFRPARDSAPFHSAPPTITYRSPSSSLISFATSLGYYGDGSIMGEP